MPMELRHLNYFIAVAQERHFGNAARRLRMAQPPLSQQIKAFEAQLQVTLFERTTRTVSLTPAGEFLLERAQVIVADLDTLERDVRRVHAGARGILRLGSTGSAAYRVLPRVLREARRRIPDLELEIHGEILNPQIIKELSAHRLDVALLRLPVSSPELETELLQSDELLVALPSEHGLAGSEVIALDSLKGEPLVSYPQDSAVALQTTELCRAAGFTPEVLQVVQETSTLISVVAGGGCAAIIPEPVSALGTSDVVFRPLVGRPSVDLAMAWRSDDQRPLIHTLLQVIRSATQGETTDSATRTPGAPDAAGTEETTPAPEKDDEDR